MTEPDREGRRPIHYAALENRLDDAKARLAAGDDPNQADRNGFTALHFAAQQGSLEVAKLLLDGGAEVDPQNIYGNSPLWTAVFNSRGRGELIALLRQRGANPLMTNRSGRTPVDLARTIGNYNVAQYFADLL